MRSDVLRRVRWANLSLALGALATLATVIAWPLTTAPAPGLPADTARPLVEAHEGWRGERRREEGCGEADAREMCGADEQGRDGGRTRQGAKGRAGSDREGRGREERSRGRGGGVEREGREPSRGGGTRRGRGGGGKRSGRERSRGGRGGREPSGGGAKRGGRERTRGADKPAGGEERPPAPRPPALPAPSPRAPTRNGGAPKEFGFEGKR